MKRYKDCPKKSLTVGHVDHRWLSCMVVDGDAWGNSIFKAINELEGDRRDRQKKQKESSSCHKHHTGCYLHLWTLLTVLPFLQRTRQSRRGQTSLSSFVKSSHYNYNVLFCYLHRMRSTRACLQVGHISYESFMWYYA